MATKPELKRAIANTKIKASDYNFNFDKLNDYIENGIADNAINFYEPDRAYKKGQWVMFTGENGSSLYESLIDGNKGNSLTDNNFWVRKTFGFEVPLLQSFWSDHILNRVDLLRADTFSWQSGTMYQAVFDELKAEYDNENCVEETEGGITFKRTPNGYKIADSTQETAILDRYNTYGIAWYYILDKDNTQFKLPRTKFGFEGVRDSVGNDIQAGLPNIATSGTRFRTNIWSALDETVVDGPFKGITNKYQYATQQSTSGQVDRYSTLQFNAAQANPIYGNSTTVQEPATQMYLYFYVGNYTQTAIEQTAGLNSELFNNKADKTEVEPLKTAYITETYVKGTSGYRVWSDGWCEQWGTIQGSATGTLTLLKRYADTSKYRVLMSWDLEAVSSTDSDGYSDAPVVSNRTVNTFRYNIVGSTTSYRVSWYAIGYSS